MSQDIKGKSIVIFRLCVFSQNENVLMKSYMVLVTTNEMLFVVIIAKKRFCLTENYFFAISCFLKFFKI